MLMLYYKDMKTTQGKKPRKSNAGRKLFDGQTEEIVLQKLEQVFSLDGTDEEACSYADISMAALYAYQKRNPRFLERKRRLKDKPILKARSSIVKALDDPNHSKWYLEKKRKKEFGNTLDVTSGNEKLTAFDDKQINAIAERITRRSANGGSKGETEPD